MKKNTAMAATMRANEASDPRENHTSKLRPTSGARRLSASMPIERKGRATMSTMVAGSGKNVVTHFAAATSTMASSSARATSSVDERA